ncbi:MAG: hypothetical protein AB7T27_08705 [Kiritimatiellia bacterium]
MITRRQVSDRIDDAGASFEQCWDKLDNIRQARPDSDFGQAILSLQPELATALGKLDKLRLKLHGEKRQLIDRKDKLNARWFTHRMQMIASYHEAIDAAIDIGKTIGDAFAWLFYQDEREWLSRHEQHQRQRHLPPGLGGRGEIEFIRNAPMFWGYLVLYHGITTYLRLGDVSLIDLAKRRVIGIGELKTTAVEGNKLSMQMTIVGHSNLRPPEAPVSRPREAQTHLTAAMEDRLRRQVKAMKNAFHQKTESTLTVQHKIHTTSHHSALSAIEAGLATQRCTHAKAGDGLLLTAFTDHRSHLSARLMGGLPPWFNRSLEDLVPKVMSICDKSSKYNSIHIGTIHYSSNGYSHFHGMIPLYWWPLKTTFLHDLAFRRVVIAGFYNPAFLVGKVRDRGFEVRHSDGDNSFEIERKTADGRSVRLEGFAYLASLVHYHLINEETILAFLDKVLQEAEDPKYVGKNLKFSMDIQHVQSMEDRTSPCIATTHSAAECVEGEGPPA